MSGSFFFFGVYLFLLLFIFIIILLLPFLIAFFNNENNTFFAHRYVPSVIKAKRIAVGLFQCNLAKDGIPLLYLNIFVLNTIVSSRFLNFDYSKLCS